MDAGVGRGGGGLNEPDKPVACRLGQVVECWDVGKNGDPSTSKDGGSHLAVRSALVPSAGMRATQFQDRRLIGPVPKLITMKFILVP